MARKPNGEHHQTSRVERFVVPDRAGANKENMFDFVVQGAQKDFAEKLNGQAGKS